MVCIVCSTPKSPDKSRFKLHTMAKNGVQDSVHGVQGSVHERRNARIGITSQAHAASLLYVHPHPTAARRAATLASSGCEMHIGARTSSDRFRGVLRHEKKPEGYTSTPAGLKRLKTQNTAFHGNGNGKGTPSGVPQPIHKRKLVLVKEEFDASSFGGTTCRHLKSIEKGSSLTLLPHLFGYSPNCVSLSADLGALGLALRALA